MTRVVVDASAVLAWLIVSQATKAAETFLRDSRHRTFVAPYVVDWEIKNVLLALVRSNRLGQQGADPDIEEAGQL